MDIRINGVEIAVYPKKFVPQVMDLDDSETTVRGSDGTLTRDRIAVKRKIDMEWGLLTWSQLSTLLQQMSGVFFDVYYPDPMTGNHQTKTFYVGNRQSPALYERNNIVYLEGLTISLTER